MKVDIASAKILIFQQFTTIVVQHRFDQEVDIASAKILIFQQFTTTKNVMHRLLG